MHLHRMLPILGVLLLTAVSASAGDWPDDPRRVVGSFGAGRNGGFVPGLEFLSDGQRVQTWSAGELIWTSGPGYMDGSIPSTGLVVVEHQDGFRSAYRHVEARPDSVSRIRDGQWIGYAGHESWMFIVRDSRMEKVIDPLTLLPTREDLSDPRIGDVVLFSGNERLPVINGMEISSGNWSLLLDLAYQGGDTAIPTEISVFWVGEQVGLIRIDSLEENDGRVLADTPDPVSYEALYDENGSLILSDIRLNAGRGILELRISDESGRVLRRVWNLSIRNR